MFYGTGTRGSTGSCDGIGGRMVRSLDGLLGGSSGRSGSGVTEEG